MSADGNNIMTTMTEYVVLTYVKQVGKVKVKAASAEEARDTVLRILTSNPDVVGAEITLVLDEDGYDTEVV